MVFNQYTVNYFYFDAVHSVHSVSLSKYHVGNVLLKSLLLFSFEFLHDEKGRIQTRNR